MHQFPEQEGILVNVIGFKLSELDEEKDKDEIAGLKEYQPAIEKVGTFATVEDGDKLAKQMEDFLLQIHFHIDGESGTVPKGALPEGGGDVIRDQDNVRWIPGLEPGTFLVTMQANRLKRKAVEQRIELRRGVECSESLQHVDVYRLALATRDDPVDVREHHKDVCRSGGFMPDFPPVYEDLMVWEFLDLFAASYGVPRPERQGRIDKYIELTDLTEKRHAMTAGLSRGMKQRVMLAKTLLPEPQILLLDEPASGMAAMLSGRPPVLGLTAAEQLVGVESLAAQAARDVFPVRLGGHQDHGLVAHQAFGGEMADGFAVEIVILIELDDVPAVSGLGQHADVSMHAAANVTTESGTFVWLVAHETIQRQTGRHAATVPTLPVQCLAGDGRYVTTGFLPHEGRHLQAIEETRRRVCPLWQTGLLQHLRDFSFEVFGAPRRPAAPPRSRSAGCAGRRRRRAGRAGPARSGSGRARRAARTAGRGRRTAARG